MDNIKICCFTGHRPKGLPWGYDESSKSCKEFKAELKQIIKQKICDGYNYFITGMAEGFDTYATEILVDERDKGNASIFIEGAIPCPFQDKKWSTESKTRYNKLLNKLDKKTIVQDHYTPYCMIKRNEYMLEKSSLVIAGFDNTPSGGTYSTIQKAVKQNKNIVIINPKDF